MNFLQVIDSRENDSFYNTVGSKEEKEQKIDDAMYHLALKLICTFEFPNYSEGSEYCQYYMNLPILKIDNISVNTKLIFDVETRKINVKIRYNNDEDYHMKTILHQRMDFAPEITLKDAVFYYNGNKEAVRKHQRPFLVDMISELDLERLFTYIFSLYWKEENGKQILKYRKEQKMDDCCICMEQTHHHGECGHHVCKDCNFKTWLNLQNPNKKFEIPCPICRRDFHYDEEGRNITK